MRKNKIDHKKIKRKRKNKLFSLKPNKKEYQNLSNKKKY